MQDKAGATEHAAVYKEYGKWAIGKSRVLLVLNESAAFPDREFPSGRATWESGLLRF